MTYGYQNLHTHTNYCDGRQPPEEMIQAALSIGCDSIGFSDHSYIPSDPGFSMTPETSAEYVREINAMKSKYEGTIEVFLGLELDCYTAIPYEGFDYIVGSVHYLKIGEEFRSVDSSGESLRLIVDNHFGGDYNSMLEAYFETVAVNTGRMNTDIVGHFDLVTKFNFDGNCFDETHPRYIRAALDAMDEVLKDCRLFEVNTAPMFKFGKPAPYPSAFLLKELLKRGGEVLLSSDSHVADSLCYKFGEVKELLKSIGFKYIKRLTKTGFIDVEL